MLPSRLAPSLIVALLTGCSGSGGDRAGAGGAEACTWCAPTPPHVRICASVMIASGGQRVCVDAGEAWLCEPPDACRGE